MQCRRCARGRLRRLGVIDRAVNSTVVAVAGNVKCPAWPWPSATTASHRFDSRERNNVALS